KISSTNLQMAFDFDGLTGSLIPGHPSQQFPLSCCIGLEASIKRAKLLRSSPPLYCPAITSISTNASFGKRDTCTVDRAGGADVKYFPYTSFMAAKSFMSFRKTVVFTT